MAEAENRSLPINIIAKCRPTTTIIPCENNAVKGHITDLDSFHPEHLCLIGCDCNHSA
ncbi:hypothetical protein COLO4_36432 [Corchorus olitorius]|uniref:Uncharacterized protein n=1 Tax=Corchorus olitorius TaxID=93759 RepID=A0A1R3G8W9_9ROSI|nr:hypothetical protein COLO4_36432 [Corchorus olitorius]